MKRFIFSVLAVVFVCVGAGAIVERAGASFKSDEKALAIISDARRAIGGETALIAIRSMAISGNVTRTIKIDGVEKTIQGESEIAIQLPDKLMRTIAIKDGDGTKGGKMIQRQVDVVVAGDGERKVTVKGEGSGAGNGVKKIVIKKDDGTVHEYTGADAERIIAEDGGPAGDNVRKIVIKRADGSVETKVTSDSDSQLGKTISINGDRVMMRRADGGESIKQNEMLRLTLSLLLTAPQGMDVNYTYAGESDVDGTACNIVVAETGGSAFKLFIGKSSSLPVMITYKGMRMPNIVMFRHKAPEGGEPKETVTFNRKVESPAESAEFSVKFADYRSVNGVQLPFKWSQTIGGVTDEVFDVTAFEINPANIADRFNNDKVRVKFEEN
jgi:hypothetical protein